MSCQYTEYYVSQTAFKDSGFFSEFRTFHCAKIKGYVEGHSSIFPTWYFVFCWLF